MRPFVECRRPARLESLAASHDREKKSKYARHRSAGPYIYGRLCGFASLVDDQKFLQPLPFPFLLVLLVLHFFFHFILLLLLLLLLFFFPSSTSFLCLFRRCKCVYLQALNLLRFLWLTRARWRDRVRGSWGRVEGVGGYRHLNASARHSLSPLPPPLPSLCP